MTGIEQWLLPGSASEPAVDAAPRQARPRVPEAGRPSASRSSTPSPTASSPSTACRSVFVSNTNHDENQPAHLTLKDAAVPVAINLATLRRAREPLLPGRRLRVRQERRRRATGCRSTRRTACTARPATSRTRRRTSSGSRRRAAAGRTTRGCSARAQSMTESDARDVVLVRAWESAPSAAWSKSDAERASREAARLEGEHASPERLIVRRAALAAAQLSEREPAVRQALATSRAPRWVGWAVVSVAFFIGLASDALGPARRVDLLAPALLALLAWNLAVYLLLALSALRAKGEAPFGPLRRALSGAVVRQARHAVGAVGRFVVDWRDASRALDAARIASLLHASAAAIAAGALAALYLRGLAFEYRAGWDSTFLTPAAVHQLLSFVLGPASALSGIALPDARAPGEPALVGRQRRERGALDPSARAHDRAGRAAAARRCSRCVSVARAATGARIRRCRSTMPYFRALLREQRRRVAAGARAARTAIAPPPEALDGLRARARAQPRRQAAAARRTARRARQRRRRCGGVVFNARGGDRAGRRVPVRADRDAGARAPRRVRACAVAARRPDGADRRIGLSPAHRRRGARSSSAATPGGACCATTGVAADVRRPRLAAEATSAVDVSLHTQAGT